MVIHISGMFLGYAIVQLPGFFFSLFGCVKSRSKVSGDSKEQSKVNSVETVSESKPDVPAEFKYTDPPKFLLKY